MGDGEVEQAAPGQEEQEEDGEEAEEEPGEGWLKRPGLAGRGAKLKLKPLSTRLGRRGKEEKHAEDQKALLQAQDSLVCNACGGTGSILNEPCLHCSLGDLGEAPSELHVVNIAGDEIAVLRGLSPSCTVIALKHQLEALMLAKGRKVAITLLHGNTILENTQVLGALGLPQVATLQALAA